ncbi:hypothetical protein LBW12_02720 [Latilactobacillus curvatus]|uniref:glycerophosphodiester phosphodiesterase n=1 Tax=Latilactobacillus curvatus TaxID=28038 RepID=UPI0020C7ED7C|nr:glycerophosphodiester phosphodiesterase family protein [Latilactobacillus curvatus]MCP8858939.1 hypothetical protein [Latilactobacillus curvatus]
MAIVENEGQPLQDRAYRQHLNRNWDNINGFEKTVNKQFKQVLSDPPASTADEVTQLRIDTNGNEYPLAKPRIDSIERDASYAAGEVVKKADKDYVSTYLSQISHVPETVTNLAELNTKYPNGKPGLFIAADNGHKYIWTSGAWKDSGVYQATGLADGSVKAKHLSSAAMMGVKIVTGAGLPTYNTTTRIWNWGGSDKRQAIIYVGDNSYTLIEPQLSIVNEGTNAASKLIWDGSTFSFIEWQLKTPVGSYVVALITNFGDVAVTADFPVIINGSLNVADSGNSGIITPNVVQMYPCAGNPPRYDSKKQIFDFNSRSTNPATIQTNKEFHLIPVGTVAHPTQAATTNYRKKVVYDLNNDTAKIMGYWEKIPPYNVIVCLILSGEGQPTKVLSDFETIIDGVAPTTGIVDNKKDANITAILHRGYCSKYPEESELAYVQGVKELGTHNWEGDIAFTKDNIPVMIHDVFIEKSALNMDGSEITEKTDMRLLTLKELNTKYDFGLKKDEQFQGTKLLTFDDFCKLAKRFDAFVHVEFKYPYTAEQIKILYDIVVKWHMQDNIAWQAFKRDMLKPMQALMPAAQIELLMHASDVINDAFYEDAKTYETGTNRVAISMDNNFTDEQIADVVRRGYYVIIWIAWNQNDINRLADLGVSAIMSNGLNIAEVLNK